VGCSYQALANRAAVRLLIFSGQLPWVFELLIENAATLKNGDKGDFHLEICSASGNLISR
jgi:hypothetical protein